VGKDGECRRPAPERELGVLDDAGALAGSSESSRCSTRSFRLSTVSAGVRLVPRPVEKDRAGVTTPSVAGGVMEKEGVLARADKLVLVWRLELSSGSVSIEGIGTSGSKSSVPGRSADSERLPVEEGVHCLGLLGSLSLREDWT